MLNHYKTLGVSKQSPMREIRDAYYRLAKLHHPDQPGGSGCDFKPIAEAWRVLSAPDSPAYRSYHFDLSLLARCEGCRGTGAVRTQVGFTSASYATCEACGGSGVIVP